MKKNNAIKKIINNSFFHYVIIIIILQFLINYYLHKDFKISYHVLIRNIIIFSTFYIFSNTKKIIYLGYGLLSLTLLEIIYQVTLLNGIMLEDERLLRVKNYYKWHDIVIEQVHKYKDNPEKWSATEGRYCKNENNCDLNKSVEVAQKAQHDFILDKLDVKEGTRIIDLGCGYGNLLNEAKKRGAKCFGVSLSEPQIKYLKNKLNIDGIVCDYHNLPDELNGKFDCMVSNGSLEHLAFIEDKKNNLHDKQYEEFFENTDKLFDPNSNNKKRFISCLHKDTERVKKWNLWDWFNAYIIQMTYGGYYPDAPNGLTKNMKNYKIIYQYNAMKDYEITSRIGIDGAEYDFGSKFIRNKRLSGYFNLFLMLLNDPYYIHKELYYTFNSWRWQFDKGNCPHYWIVGKYK